MCDADGRATTGPVYCAGVSQCFDDIGINHPPMNSGVISLNSPWLPLDMTNYNNNESKLSVNRRPAMGSITYTYKNIIVINDYHRLMARKVKTLTLKCLLAPKLRLSTHTVMCPKVSIM